MRDERNTRTFSVTVSLNECVEYDHNTHTNSYGGIALEELKHALNAYGIGCDFEYSSGGGRATIKIDHMEPWDAKRARTRHAGRPKKNERWPEESGATDRERLAWCTSQSVDELADALGVSRRTAQRRLADLRAKVRQ